MKYNFGAIEKKWQKIWNKSKIYQAADISKNPKWYSLIEFPYPSGAGLHTGHIRSNTAMDIISRKRRMEGYNVLYPIGWDAFGLPTENYAIKTGISPQVATKENSDTFRRQLKSLGFSFDWSREINTTDPKYYKWTQWLFLKFFERGLAYKTEMSINWCPKDKVGLANEEVVAGKCERCGTPVVKKQKAQWMLKITAYADKLLEGLKTVDYLPEIKTQQENWIGRSEGAEIEFKLEPEVEPTFYQFFEPGIIKDDEPFVEREAIIAVVKHWSQEKYIGLKWKKVDWETFITGGVEKGQSPEEAARAEITEETGYKNLKLVKNLGRMHSKFFHVPKNHNRFGHFTIFYFELQNGERNETAEEEKNIHDVLWLMKGELDDFGLPSSHRYVWELLQSRSGKVEKEIKVFTTRADTLFGATYLVLAPEHPLVGYFIHQASNCKEIDHYIKEAARRTEMERTAEDKEKTGVELKGIKAINPANQKEIPVWISDYVLASYGTGAIMAVPAHDERDFAFAKKFKLSIKYVVAPYFLDGTGNSRPRSNVETKTRTIGVGIVKHWAEEKYLMLDWKNGWTGFITGGVEEGEDLVDTIIREIEEETGYTHVRFVKHLGGPNIADFYAPHKKLSQHVSAHGMYLELIDADKVSVSDDELKKHSVLWKNKDQVAAFLKKGSYMGDSRYSELYWERLATGNYTYSGDGLLINSDQFSGLTSEDAKKKITDFVHGKTTVKYKLRDWVFSRQRYWGEPIPIINCPNCGYVSVPEKDLPVKLPSVKNYQPRDDGESPLASVSKWVNVKCPKCKGKAKRETDTMPNWAGSSWYFLAYCLREQLTVNNKQLTKEKPLTSQWSNVVGQMLLKYWMPVDWYNGGMEHVTLHLLYSRFWSQFLFDLGLVPTAEPYKKRTAHGLVLAEGGVKMSKSKGNVVNPDPLIKEFGADALRLYEMFMGPFNQAIAWDKRGILGTSRFLERVFQIGTGKVAKHEFKDIQIEKLLHRTIKKVSEDIESMSFNTAISAMMIFINEAAARQEISRNVWELFLLILAPFAPHIAEELWQQLRGKERTSRGLTRNNQRQLASSQRSSASIHVEPWPKYDSKLIEDDTFILVVQINGKVRDSFEVQKNISAKAAEELVLEKVSIQKHLNGAKPKRIVYVPGRLINIVL